MLVLAMAIALTLDQVVLGDEGKREGRLRSEVSYSEGAVVRSKRGCDSREK